MNAAGRFVVVWESHPLGALAYEVYARVFDASGQPLGPAFSVNTYTPNRQLQPAVAMDADGDFVVVWSSYGQDGSDYGVYAQRFDANGVRRGSEFRVNNTTTHVQRHANVACDADGDFVITWESDSFDADGRGVAARIYNSDGQPRGNEFQVNVTTAFDQKGPEVAMNGSGDFVIVWSSTLQDGSSIGVYGRKFTPSGEAASDEFRANSYTTDIQHNGMVAITPTGDFVVAWDSKLQTGDDRYGIYAQRYNSSAQPVGGEFRVNTYTTSDQDIPTIAVNDVGDFVVAWTSLGQDGDAWGAYARRYDRFGHPEGVEFLVNTYTTGNQARPAVALDAWGNGVITWWGASATPSSSFQGRRYALTRPSVTASEFVFETAPHALRATFSTPVSATLGTDDLAVVNLDTNQTLPASDFALAYDAATDTATFSYLGNGGLFSDGHYRATLAAREVRDAGGTSMLGDQVINFFFLQADANRDGTVDLADFNLLAANFGTTNATFSRGDFNYDGVVDLQDFNILAQRFGTALSAPALPVRSLFSSRCFAVTEKGDPVDELTELLDR
jgi:hypothetical protein